MNFLRSFLDNESKFGQLMTRAGILIAANLTFLLFSIPVITIGPAWTALHYTMLKTLREREINPFTTFWQGFRENFRESLLAEVVFVAAAGILLLELYWCSQWEGFLRHFQFGLFAILAVVVIAGIYLFPVVAAFYGGFGQHMKSSLYFAVNRLQNMIIILFVNCVPLALTYIDSRRMPLYAFLWFFIGFAAVAMLTDSLLLPQFEPFLDSTNEEYVYERTQREILKEMEKLDY